MKLLHLGELNGGKMLQPKVTGHDMRKPLGENIIWTSPLESSFGWLDLVSQMSPETKRWKRWVLELSSKALIAKVDCFDDLKSLVALFPTREPYAVIDWPNLAQLYDAFWLTAKGEKETKFSEPHHLYGWGCESVAVFNTAVVRVVSEEKSQV